MNMARKILKHRMIEKSTSGRHSTRRYNVDIDAGMWRELKSWAARNDMFANQALGLAIADFLDRNKKASVA